jgi:MFS transporter, DHA1 family, tetracycline resistance protein
MDRRASTSETSVQAAPKAAREPMPKGYWPIWSTVLIDMIGFGIALPVLGIYAKDKFGATGFQVGMLGAAYSAAQFLFAPVLGKLSDKIGRKPIFMYSLLGTAVAAMLTGFAGSVWMLILWRFVDGSTGASYGAANAAVGDLAPPERRSTLIGMLGAAFGIGFTVGPAIGSLVSWGFGERAPFFFLAGLSAINAVAVLIRVKETKGLAQAQAEALDSTGDRAGLAVNWRQAGLPALLAIGFLTAFGFSSFETLFSAFGRDNLGLTRNNAGFALAAVGIVSTIVQGGLIGPVSKKVKQIHLIRGGLIGTAIGLAMFAAASGWALLIPSMIVTAAAMGFLGPSLGAEVTNRVDPLQRGAIGGISQSAAAAAAVAGPLVGGLLYDKIDPRSPFFVAAGLFSISAVVLWFARSGPESGAASTAATAPAPATATASLQ